MENGMTSRSETSRRGLGLRSLAGLLAIASVGAGCGGEEALDYAGPVDGWPHVGGDLGGSRFSSNSQIDPRLFHPSTQKNYEWIKNGSCHS